MSDETQVVFAIGRDSSGGVQLLGTAFSIGGGLLATPFHVATADDRDLVAVMPGTTSINAYQDTSRLDVQFVSVTIVAADPVLDICILRMNGATAHGLQLGSTDDVKVGEQVSLFGFPHARERLVFTQQVAHVGARILIDSTGQKLKHVVLNTQAREGQSGAPVIHQRTRRVVAMVIGSFASGGGGQISLGGVDPATLHQTTHAISAEYIHRLLP